MRALISCGVYFLPSISGDFQLVPISRLTLRMVRSTLVTAWFLADWPTRTSPFLAKATTEGVVRDPSELAMTVGSPPSRTVTTELVVPRSIPTARSMELASLSVCCGGAGSDPVVGVHDLASGPLNFPAQTNGTSRTCVPHPARKFRGGRAGAGGGRATIRSPDPNESWLTVGAEPGTPEVSQDEAVARRQAASTGDDPGSSVRTARKRRGPANGTARNRRSRGARSLRTDQVSS